MIEKINVTLCITTYNFVSGDYLVLTNFHGNLPKKSSVLPSQPMDLVRAIGKDITGLEDNWLNYKIRTCYIEDDELGVIYSVCIPLDTIKDDGRYMWRDVTLLEIDDKQAILSVGEAIKEIV